MMNNGKVRDGETLVIQVRNELNHFDTSKVYVSVLNLEGRALLLKEIQRSFGEDIATSQSSRTNRSNNTQ